MDQNSKIKTAIARIIQRILTLNFDPDVIDNLNFKAGPEYPSNILVKINYAFLKVLINQSEDAYHYIDSLTESSAYGEIAQFYLRGIDLMYEELQSVYKNNREFARNLDSVAHSLEKQIDNDVKKLLAEKFWSVFFPEAENMLFYPAESIEKLRQKRRIRIEQLNPSPIVSPLDEIIFTSNILLTLPADNKVESELNLDKELKTIISAAKKDTQLYWFDHPVQMGVALEKNEVIYGLNALNEAVAFEKKRNSDRDTKKLTCILSVSVTHDRLHQLVKPYLESELKRAGNMDHMEFFIFTETETDALINQILVPAAVYYLDYDAESARELLSVFGVDGEYGRHYSFLKAISLFWHILIDPRMKATFKIDLDQVFPQESLVSETGKSAFEHLCSPLWGAKGRDHNNHTVELGMIAGALVNDKDISRSLFTADVPLPQGELSADEYVFFSKLPQAISTAAEMLTRYNSQTLDGRKYCIQRVHVTGGTTGILVDSLRRHRPYTPSFFGRAEDQAYLLSVLDKKEYRLAYVHKDGLIMRHDKESFARESIQAAAVGKLIGDYTRILLFSAYARYLRQDLLRIKELLDPFTGGFISKIPVTLVYLRFVLKAISLFINGDEKTAVEFIRNGVSRITKTLLFITDKLNFQLPKEKEGWDLYFDILDTVCRKIERGDPFSLELREKASKLIDQCRITV